MFSIPKVLGSATRKTSNRLAEALRLAALGLERAKCRLGEYCRRMTGRLGKAEGITATAHELARVIYAMIANGRAYDEDETFHKNPGIGQKQQKTSAHRQKKPCSNSFQSNNLQQASQEDRPYQCSSVDRHFGDI